MNKIKIILTTAIFSCVLLCFQCAMPALKHLPLEHALDIWFSASVMSLLGPFVSFIYQVPFFIFIPIGKYFVFALTVILIAIIFMHYKNSNSKNTVIKLVTFLWVSIGAYFSIIVIESGI